MAVPIPVSFVNGDKPTSAQTNAWGKALNGLGIATDNDAKPIIPLSLDVPFPIVGSAASTQTKAVGGGTSYIVPSGKLFYVRSLTLTTAGVVTLTPSGGSVFTTTGAASIYASPTGLCLGAGDTITTAAGVYALGVLCDLPSLPSAPTRVLQEISNTASYTVPAGKMLLLTHAYPSTTGTLTALTIDGVSAFATAAIFAVAARYPDWQPTYLQAGQSLAVATANNYTISGLLYSA